MLAVLSTVSVCFLFSFFSFLIIYVLFILHFVLFAVRKRREEISIKSEFTEIAPHDSNEKKNWVDGGEKNQIPFSE